MATKAMKNKDKKDVEKKKKPQVVEDKEALKEIDKAFYEIQITDLNQKLARLRSRLSELETENEETKKNLQKLDEDRADIIAYQKRTMQNKSDEITELQERLVTLQQAREEEKNTFVERIKVMEHDFKSMHVQLNAEIKLLHGKVNSLEEFRREREELMNKFLKQEQEMEDQEKRHEITLYEVERKFIVGKDELKKDMEHKLLQLSLDFQNTTDVRIETTTHRVIRENVGLNNEINVLLKSWKKLVEENKDLKAKCREVKIEAQIQREDNKILVRKNTTQNKIIEKITSLHSRMEDSYKELEQIKRHEQALESKLDGSLSDLRRAHGENQLLRQVIENLRAEECEHEVELHALRRECSMLREVIENAVHTITGMVETRSGHGEDNSSEKTTEQREDHLMLTLMDLFHKIDFTKTHHPAGVKDSVVTLTATDIITQTNKISKHVEEKHEDEEDSLGSKTKTRVPHK